MTQVAASAMPLPDQRKPVNPALISSFMDFLLLSGATFLILPADLYI
jgi:hypothetical protein